MLALLGERYVNCWVLAKDLDRIAAGTDDPELKRLCRQVKDNYGYPVDSVLLSPGLEVLGHKNANESLFEGPSDYVAFLRRGLGEEVPDPQHQHGPGLTGGGHDHDGGAGAGSLPDAPPGLVLDADTQSGSLLDVFETTVPGHMRFRMFEIDTTAFPNGGTLEIVVSVGTSQAVGTFELMRSTGEMALTPVAQAVDVQPGTTATIVYSFSAGTRFVFGARGAAGQDEGLHNAFHAELSMGER